MTSHDPTLMHLLYALMMVTPKWLWEIVCMDSGLSRKTSHKFWNAQVLLPLAGTDLLLPLTEIFLNPHYGFRRQIRREIS